MKDRDAVAALSALAHDSRLQIFRLLVRRVPDGLPAGEIATRIGVSPSNVSFHLNTLEHAGLCAARRDKQRIIYSLNLDTTRSLLSFLTEDCCQGQPSICGDLFRGAGPGTGEKEPEHA